MRPLSTLLVLALGCALAGAIGCSSDDPDGEGGSGGTGAGTGTGTTPEPACTGPAEVPCSDQVIQEMNLQTDIAPGLLTTEPDGQGFRSFIDATAGGAFAADPDSYVYGRFTDAGLEKVEISDEASLDSMDWDIAFRRYVVRINSGYSGPSCVGAVRIPGDPLFEDVAAPPTEVSFRKDDYFTDSCDIIPDGSGLENSPATALSGYWTYPGCVSMSNYVYAMQLASGRTLKLQVELYYSADVQEQCDSTGMVPMSGSNAANFQIRWAFFQ